MSNTYRFDKRTKRQFKKDIAHAHITEAEIAIRIAVHEHMKTEEWPLVKGVGTDFTGKFIDKPKQVSSIADFKIGDSFVEITKSENECKQYFHEKISKVDRCIRDGYDLVFVNGIRSGSIPFYVRLTPTQLLEFTEKSKKEFGIIRHPGTGNKDGYRYLIKWFKNYWEPLPEINDNIPRRYKNLLKKVAVNA